MHAEVDYVSAYVQVLFLCINISGRHLTELDVNS